MRIFKYWKEYTREIQINGETQKKQIFGGSDVSMEDTERDADERIAHVQKILDSGQFWSDDFVEDLIEEIVYRIDDENVVSLNNYGETILTTKKYMFIDIERYSYSIFARILGINFIRKKLTFKRIKQTMKSPRYDQFGFRVYETYKGFRLVVMNIDFEPKSRESEKLMEEFNGDPKYFWHVKKQNCYRARLTPKSSRVKKRAEMSIYPRRSIAEREEIEDWRRGYEAFLGKYAICRLLATHGKSAPDSIIEFHDVETLIDKNLPLR